MTDPDSDPDYFRNLLLELERSLLAIDATSEEAAQTVELDQTRVGRLSRMDAMQVQAMSQAANQRRKKTLNAIKAALARLDRGEYGYCTGCAEPINPKRLEFDPTVRTCIGCVSE